MALTPGARLGPYEVAAQIGVGGMGEVYQATDTNLKRQVAIKVLPEALAADPDRLARFQREAEVTSQRTAERRMSGMPRRARVMTWNGKDVPPELRELPAGRYVVEAVEDEAPALSPEEEAGIEAALESYRQGRVVDAKRAREIIDAALGR